MADGEFKSRNKGGAAKRPGVGPSIPRWPYILVRQLIKTANQSNIIFLEVTPPGPRPGTEFKSNFYCMFEGTETIHPVLSFRAAARNLEQSRFLVAFAPRHDRELSFWNINIYFQVT